MVLEREWRGFYIINGRNTPESLESNFYGLWKLLPCCTRLFSSYPNFVHLSNARINQYFQPFIPFSGNSGTSYLLLYFQLPVIWTHWRGRFQDIYPFLLANSNLHGNWQLTLFFPPLLFVLPLSSCSLLTIKINKNSFLQTQPAIPSLAGEPWSALPRLLHYGTGVRADRAGAGRGEDALHPQHRPASTEPLQQLLRLFHQTLLANKLRLVLLLFCCILWCFLVDVRGLSLSLSLCLSLSFTLAFIF